METFVMDNSKLTAFEQFLYEKECKKTTIVKYVHDVKSFASFAQQQCINRQLVIQYKAVLEKTYAISSANSMLAALNTFFKFLQLDNLCVKLFKIQQNAFCSSASQLTKSEYKQLIKVMEAHGDSLMSLVIQTLASTGARVSELAYFTLESIKKAEIIINNKGKSRKILMPKELQKQILVYAKKQGITSGPVFLTRRKNPVSRDFVWRKMKTYGRLAGIDERKIYPHNLRHLFAHTFYELTKDIAKLADVLGHSSVNTTRLYIKGTGSEHRAQLDAMHMVVTTQTPIKNDEVIQKE